MTGPSLAGDPAPKATSTADRVLVAATTAFLFVAPAAASTGWRLMALSFAGFAILAAGRGRLWDDVRPLPRPLLAAFAAWAAIAALSYFWSEAPHYSVREIKTEIGYSTLAFVVFMVAAHRIDRWHLWRKTLLLATVLTFTIAFVQEIIPWHINRQSMDGGPGPWSTHLVLMAPLLLAISWPRPWGEGRRGGWTVAALVLLALAAWKSENRIVWAALGVQLALAALLVGVQPSIRGDASRRTRRVMLVGAVSVVVLFGASIIERSERLFGDVAATSTSLERDLRPRLWSVAWEEVRNAPWLGHGFGREIRGTQFLAMTPRGAGHEHPPTRHSHNLFTDMAVQLGLVGLAAFLLVLALLAREYRGYLRDARVAPWGIAGLALLAGFVVKNLTDDFLYRHNALIFWALNAMLVGLATRARRAAAGG